MNVPSAPVVLVAFTLPPLSSSSTVAPSNGVLPSPRTLPLISDWSGGGGGGAEPIVTGFEASGKLVVATPSGAKTVMYALVVRFSRRVLPLVAPPDTLMTSRRYSGVPETTSYAKPVKVNVPAAKT